MESRLQLKLLAPEEITAIYGKCQDVLSKIGMMIDHPHALKMLEKEEAWIDYKSRQFLFLEMIY